MHDPTSEQEVVTRQGSPLSTLLVTLLGQETHEVVHALEAGAVDTIAPLTAADDQLCLHEASEMTRTASAPAHQGAVLSSEGV